MAYPGLSASYLLFATSGGVACVLTAKCYSTKVVLLLLLYYNNNALPTLPCVCQNNDNWALRYPRMLVVLILP